MLVQHIRNRHLLPWALMPLLMIPVALLMGARLGHATSTKAPLTLADLTVKSDLVVHGFVESINYVRKEGKGIWTHISVRPTAIVKGDPSLTSVLVEQYGGCFDGKTTFMVGAPKFVSGEEVVLFLRQGRDPSKYQIATLAEGKFDVVRERDVLPSVRRDLSGLGYAGPVTLPTIPDRLEELLDAVRAAAR